MKKINFEVKKDSKNHLDRQLISKFGNSVYFSPDVKAITIKVYFKDGSSIGFMRDEEEDELEDYVKGKE